METFCSTLVRTKICLQGWEIVLYRISGGGCRAYFWMAGLWYGHRVTGWLFLVHSRISLFIYLFILSEALELHLSQAYPTLLTIVLNLHPSRICGANALSSNNSSMKEDSHFKCSLKTRLSPSEHSYNQPITALLAHESKALVSRIGFTRSEPVVEK